MLSHIFVKDLAIVSSLELELPGGMTALTGETGAGKSILIDALGLALGDKADADMIRAGCEQAEVVAGFDLNDCPQARRWLVEQSLDDDGEDCIIRRLLVRAGRSRAYINGRPVGGAQLQSLGELLVDIHGQHAHQSLLRPASQRALLDGYGGHTDLADEVEGLFRVFRDWDERLTRLETESSDRAARLELLRYQTGELGALGLNPGEIEELDREQKRLANLGQLQGTSARILERIYDGEPSLHGELSRAASEIEGLASIDGRLTATLELITGAGIQLEEAAGNLRQYLADLELDPGQLDQVETRLAQVHDLARKYRVRPEELPGTLERLRDELAELEEETLSLGTLSQDRDGAHQAFLTAARRLTDARQEAAGRLSETVTSAMQGLGMGGGRFAVDVDRGNAENAGPHGLDRVEFLVSANPGQPLQPLAKVASGGELSRISLAIQVATAECGSVPTLVFDEVDVGIGGGVAEIVGRLLRTLAGARQILCVTHLPQVAAQAHHHLQVSKSTHGGQTFAGIQCLDDEERVGEIARMLGGREITRKTLEHAREMIDRSQAASPSGRATG
jgi:DNA repair protein RecN (Recombination protein N)